MKRSIVYFLLLSLTSPTLTGCFGKFALTRTVYNANASVPHKVLRTVVMWAFVLVPVYLVTGLIDVIVLNTIEFWGGHNPVASAEKSFRYVEGDRRFDVTAVKSGNEVTYTINRFSRDRYLDTLTITCDLADSTARAALRNSAGVTEYAATGIGGSMRTAGPGTEAPDRAVSLFSLNR